MFAHECDRQTDHTTEKCVGSNSAKKRESDANKNIVHASTDI